MMPGRRLQDGHVEHLGVPIPKLPGFCTSYPIPVLTLQSTTDMLGWVQKAGMIDREKGLECLGTNTHRTTS